MIFFIVFVLHAFTPTGCKRAIVDPIDHKLSFFQMFEIDKSLNGC